MYPQAALFGRAVGTQAVLQRTCHIQALVLDAQVYHVLEDGRLLDRLRACKAAQGAGGA